MTDKVLVSFDNAKSVISQIYNDLKTKINNKDISLPYTTQLSKSSYIHIDGDGTMFLNNNGEYSPISNILEDINDINKIYEIFDIVKTDYSWNNSSNTNIPVPSGSYRMYFGAICYNDNIYCFGGYTPIVLNLVSIYNISTNAWSSGTNMPTAKYNFACVEYNGKVYCIAGSNGSNLNKVEIYDISSNTWSTGATMPVTASGIAAVEYNGKIYCFTVLGKLYIYDILTNTWSTGMNMITARYNFGAIEYNGKIYCMGGSIGPTATDIVEIYDIASNTWSTGVSMITTVYGFSSIIDEDKIYCFGGYNSSTIKKTQLYNITTNTWSTIVDMPDVNGNSNHEAIYNSGKVYNIGGSYKYTYMSVLTLEKIAFNITLPDVINTKLNKIITTGDGAKVFHNDGIYKTITPSYECVSDTDINTFLAGLI